jgi:multidrug efflux system outer membrane protein
MNRPAHLPGTLRVLALGVAAALSACTTVGPDYHVPAQAVVSQPAAQAPFQEAHGEAVSGAEPPQAWWKLYDDARLNALVDQALQANTTVREAAAHLQQAMALVHEVDAEAGPHAAASVAVARARESGEAYLLSEQIPVINEGDAGVRVAYQFDLFGQLARAEEAAHAEQGASEAALSMARITVVAETVRAYVQGCAASHELTVAQQSLALQQRHLDVMQRLWASGRGHATDVTQAQSQLATLDARLPSLQAVQRGTRYRLAMLLGRTPSALSEEAVRCEALPQLHQPLPVGDGAGLLQRRPDVRQAERLLARQTARIGVATAQLYPSVSLGASTGLTGVLSHLGQDTTQRWAVGPLISWHIPDSGARARIKQAEAAAQAALAHFDGVVLQALQEVESGLVHYQGDMARQVALQRARDHANEVAQQNRRLYEAGRAPYLSRLASEQAIQNVAADLAHADGQVALDQVQLFLALGGGWE